MTVIARNFALMAMHLGHDARRAVELTCELSVDCGNGVGVLRFDDLCTPEMRQASVEGNR